MKIFSSISQFLCKRHRKLRIENSLAPVPWIKKEISNPAITRLEFALHDVSPGSQMENDLREVDNEYYLPRAQIDGQLECMIWVISSKIGHLEEFTLKCRRYSERKLDTGKMNITGVLVMLSACVKLQSIYMKGVCVDPELLIPIVQTNADLHNIILKDCSVKGRGDELIDILTKRNVHLSIFPLLHCHSMNLPLNALFKCIPGECPRYLQQFTYTKHSKLSTFNLDTITHLQIPLFDQCISALLRNPKIKAINYTNAKSVYDKSFIENIFLFPNFSKILNLGNLSFENLSYVSKQMMNFAEIVGSCQLLKGLKLPKDYYNPEFINYLYTNRELLGTSDIQSLSIPQIRSIDELHHILTIILDGNKIEELTVSIPISNWFNSKLKRLNLLYNKKVLNIPFQLSELSPRKCHIESLRIDLYCFEGIEELFEFLSKVKSLRELHLKRISACTPQFCELLGRLNLSSLCLKTNWTIDKEIVRKLAFALLGPRMNYDPEESKEYFPFSELRKLENIKLEIRGAENQYTWQMFLEIILSNTNLKKLSLNYTPAFNENKNRIFHYVPFNAFDYIIQDQRPLNLEILNVGIDARYSASLTYDLFFKYFSDQHHMRSLKIMFEDYSNSLALQNEYLFPHLPIKVKLCYFRSLDNEGINEGNKEGMWKKEFQELENQIITEWFSTFKVIVLNQIIPQMNLEGDYMYLENIPIFWEFDEMRYLVRTFEIKMMKFQEFWPGIMDQKLEYLRSEAQEGLLTRAMSQGKEIIMELCIQEVIRRNQNIIQEQVDTHLENELLRNPREKFFAHENEVE